MTGEDLKVTFGTQKKVELSLWTNPQNYIERFVILSKNNAFIASLPWGSADPRVIDLSPSTE